MKQETKNILSPKIVAYHLLCFLFLFSCTPKVASSDKNQVLAIQVSEDLSRPAVNFPTPPDILASRTPSDGQGSTSPDPQTATSVTSLQLDSDKKIYLIGDVIKLTVKFRTAVTWFGSPTIAIETNNSLEQLILTASEGIGTDTVIFTSKISEGADVSLLKISGAISNLTGTLQTMSGEKVDQNLPEFVLVDTKLTRSQTSPTSVQLPPNGTFNESFEFSVNYDTPVTIRGFPYIDVTTNTQTPAGAVRTRRAFAVRAEANKVTFRYNVQQDDADTLDGVEFGRAVNPSNPEGTLPAVLGTNSNPAKGNLSSLNWPLGSVIKAAPLLDNAALYAQFKTQAGDVFSGIAADSLSCLMTAPTPWNNGERSSCWQPQDKSSPFLSQQGTTDLEKPTLVSNPQLPIKSPFIRFLPNGTKPGLGFVPGSSPQVGQNAPRFIAIVFHVQSEVDDQPILWIDENQGLFLNPTSSSIALKSGTKLATAPHAFQLGKTLILGVWDSGTETKLKIWKPVDLLPQELALTLSPTSPIVNVFNWPLEGLKLGGRKASNGPAFEGGVNELIIYGSLSDSEQNKVICSLATKHHGYVGICP